MMETTMAHFDKKRAQAGAPGRDQAKPSNGLDCTRATTNTVRDEELEAILGDAPSAGHSVCEQGTIKAFLLKIEQTGGAFWSVYRAGLLDPTIANETYLRVAFSGYDATLKRLLVEYKKHFPDDWRVGWPTAWDIECYLQDRRRLALMAMKTVARRSEYLVSTFNKLLFDPDGPALAAEVLESTEQARRDWEVIAQAEQKRLQQRQQGGRP